MLKLSVILLLVSSLVAPAMAAKLKVEHDRDIDLGAYRTFQYAASKEHTIDDEALDERVVAALEGMLQEGGLKRVDSNPDAFATYHANTEEKPNFNSDQLGYDLGSAWGPYGSGTGVTEGTWTQGTLIVDLWDAESKKAIWRATAVKKLKDDPEQVFKQIQKALDQMLSKFQKMRATGK